MIGWISVIPLIILDVAGYMNPILQLTSQHNVIRFSSTFFGEGT